MNILKRIFILLPLSACFAFSACAQDAAEDDYDYDLEYGKELLKPGTEAPEIKMTAYDGKEFSLSGQKGKYVVLEFWASWCPDCRNEMPNFQKMYKEYAPKGVVFVGISFDDKEGQWKDAIKKYELTYIHVSELKRMRDSQIAKTYCIKWIPTMYLIDPEGKVKLATVMSSKLDKTLAEITGE